MLRLVSRKGITRVERAIEQQRSGEIDTRTKEEKFVDVAETILKTIHLHGLDALSHSRLARGAKVSRAWIYKYLGKDDSDLVRFAADLFGKHFAGIDMANDVSSREAWISSQIEGFRTLLQDTQNHPHILPIYYTYLGTQNPLGEQIREVERLWLAKVKWELEQVTQLRGNALEVTAQAMLLNHMGLAHRYYYREVHRLMDEDEFCRQLKAYLSGALPE